MPVWVGEEKVWSFPKTVFCNKSTHIETAVVGLIYIVRDWLLDSFQACGAAAGLHIVKVCSLQYGKEA
jgi:hypothetical protein